MLTLKRIVDKAEKEFEKAYEIYQMSFPEHERRSKSDQINCICDKDHHLTAILSDENEVVGLVSFWKTAKFLYIEHFAIHESQRGKSLGTKVLQKLINESDLPIILEIEPPTDEMSKKRKSFYERLGFFMHDYVFIHPAFQKNQPKHQLMIMSNPKIDDDTYFSFLSYLNEVVLKYSEVGGIQMPEMLDKPL